jgi:hypothetical protein
MQRRVVLSSLVQVSGVLDVEYIWDACSCMFVVIAKRFSLFAEEVEIAKTIIIREADSYLYGHRRVEHGSAVASYEMQRSDERKRNNRVFKASKERRTR